MHQSPISKEPVDKEAYTKSYDRAYTCFAQLYDRAVKWLPLWRNWISQAIPEIEGSRVLEVSFGTGYLMSRYAGEYDTYGIDYNARMAVVAAGNLKRNGQHAWLQQADVAALPYQSCIFDTVVNTMAFSGYPDGMAAMAELHRVLKPGGQLLIIDISYPLDGNRLGTGLARLWATLGDILRDMPALFKQFDFYSTDQEIGGSGSVHLYVARKGL